MKKSIKYLFIAITAIALACIFAFQNKTQISPIATYKEKDSISCSFSIGANIVQEICGDKFEVKSIIPNGNDIHSYEPTPQDITSIKNSIIFINGLDLEKGWLNEFIKNNDYKKIIVLTKYITPLKYPDGSYDPHAWLSVLNAILYAKVAYETLTEYFPEHEEYFTKRYNEYIAKLYILHDWVIQQWHHLSENRKIILISNDDFSRYYGQQYSVQLISLQKDYIHISAKTVKETIDICIADDVLVAACEINDNDLLLTEVIREINKRRVTKHIKIFGRIFADSLYMNSYILSVIQNTEVMTGHQL
jgi:ABC-type Zn uptake system ZnuABC Zn-binding protein ZnuA